MRPAIRSLREIFQYDFQTGVFVWKKHRCKQFVGRIAGCLHRPTGYWFLSIGNRKFKGHIIAWAHYYGRWPAFDLDHRDLDKANNRIDNLRRSDKSKNGANRSAQKNNTSGHKGVFYHSGARKWLVQIKIRSRLKYVGLFESKELAAAAYASEARKGFGEFARAK